MPRMPASRPNIPPPPPGVPPAPANETLVPVNNCMSAAAMREVTTSLIVVSRAVLNELARFWLAACSRTLTQANFVYAHVVASGLL
jgi:hypothetical protein